MEFIVACAVGLMTATGIYLILRGRSFPVVLGLVMLTYAVNLFLLAMGRLAVGEPPVIQAGQENYTDPVPQALVLTAIVISFGMTALVVVMALRAYLESNSDQVDLLPSPSEDEVRS